MSPLMCLIGPADDGMMSKSKISRRQPQRGAGVGHVDHAGDVALARRGAQDRIGLRAGIAELLEILDRVQAGLPVGDVDVEVMLLAVLVDRDAFEDQIVLVVRRDRRRLEHGILDAVFGDAVLDDVDLDVQPAGHFDGAAEGDLAVALAEVQIAHREPAAGHIDREVDLRAARQILDVAIAAMLARRHGAGAFGADLGLGVALGLTGMCAVGANGGLARPGTRVGLVAISAASRSFQVASIFGSGRQPIRPGWIRPAKFTPGMWRDDV